MADSTRSSDGRPFGTALRYWRDQRNLTLRALAPMVHSNFGQLGKI